MNDCIIAGLFSLAGILLTYFLSKNQMSQELDKRISVIDTKLIDMGNDIREHNHYAKLFSETVPVLQEQIKVVNHRIDDNKERIEKLEAK